MEYRPDARTLPPALHTSALLDLTRTIAASALAPTAPPWNALATLSAFILVLGAKLPESEFEQLQPQIWVARDANISASASISEPCIIDHEAEIRHCAFIRGGALIGKRAVVGNSTELKNALLFDEVQVPHYNYVGDSILGYKAHMGAGSITSNVRADKSKITVHAEGGLNIETGLRKFGAILGDYAEIGCNAVLNPGSVVGRYSRVYPTSNVRGVIPAYSIYKINGAIAAIRAGNSEG